MRPSFRVRPGNVESVMSDIDASKKDSFAYLNSPEYLKAERGLWAHKAAIHMTFLVIELLGDYDLDEDGYHLLKRTVGEIRRAWAHMVQVERTVHETDIYQSVSSWSNGLCDAVRRSSFPLPGGTARDLRHKFEILGLWLMRKDDGHTRKAINQPEHLNSQEIRRVKEGMKLLRYEFSTCPNPQPWPNFGWRSEQVPDHMEYYLRQIGESLQDR